MPWLFYFGVDPCRPLYNQRQRQPRSGVPAPSSRLHQPRLPAKRETEPGVIWNPPDASVSSRQPLRKQDQHDRARVPLRRDRCDHAPSRCLRSQRTAHNRPTASTGTCFPRPPPLQRALRAPTTSTLRGLRRKPHGAVRRLRSRRRTRTTCRHSPLTENAQEGHHWTPRWDPSRTGSTRLGCQAEVGRQTAVNRMRFSLSRLASNSAVQ